MSDEQIPLSAREVAQEKMDKIEFRAEAMLAGEVFHLKDRLSVTLLGVDADEWEDSRKMMSDAIDLARKGDHHNAGVMLDKAMNRALKHDAAYSLGYELMEIEEQLELDE